MQRFFSSALFKLVAVFFYYLKRKPIRVSYTINLINLFTPGTVADNCPSVEAGLFSGHYLAIKKQNPPKYSSQVKNDGLSFVPVL